MLAAVRPIPSPLIWLAMLPAAVAAGEPQSEPAAIIQAAIAAACDAGELEAASLAARLGGARVINETRLKMGDTDVGWRRVFAFDGGGRLTITRAAPRAILRRLEVDYWGPGPIGPRPVIGTIAPGDCRIALARRLLYEDGGAASAVEELDAELRPTGHVEPLNPPVPAGLDPGGVPVAMVDSGVNYLLPEIAGRLARDADGAILGYDYWDMDGRPFDTNPARSPFFPQRHGTRTASVLLREAPKTRLVPYRYPRPDMTRMADLVEDAAAKGVVVMSLTLGSRDAAEWTGFSAAVAAHPEMLFVVSAGNDGRDLDQHPVYPAALAHPNLITVTSSDLGGGLGPGANWGAESVHLLVPGERMAVTNFAGRPVEGSGSSFAAPRVAALAARLLAAHPDWRARRLKAAIFARAVSMPGRLVRVGFIPDPSRP
ncbi:MAG: S8 family serine peptidase [Kiloniellales bacterium]